MVFLSYIYGRVSRLTFSNIWCFNFCASQTWMCWKLYLSFKTDLFKIGCVRIGLFKDVTNNKNDCSNIEFLTTETVQNKCYFTIVVVATITHIFLIWNVQNNGLCHTKNISPLSGSARDNKDLITQSVVARELSVYGCSNDIYM